MNDDGDSDFLSNSESSDDLELVLNEPRLKNENYLEIMADFVKIVVLDFYMCSPIPGLDVTYSEFRGASVNQVPILRCFGSTKNGQKICVHIHGVFPYLYIPYDGVGNPETLMYQIAAQIDKAVNTSLNQGSSCIQHVYKISLVSGIPMYGYHPKKHQFFKIYLYNPLLMSTVTKLLLNRALFEKVFQPHEAHINFTLQFMIDYNLHGMSNMIINDMKYRMNPDNPNTNIDKELFLPTNIEKNTQCELEADINAESILNRQEIINGNLAANPGIAALWADEQQRRRNKNEDSQLGHFLDLHNMQYVPTKTHMIFQKALAERLAVLSTDKILPPESLDISVYPAETPRDVNLQNASIIDLHTPSSLELSLDDTMNVSASQYLDNTITSTQGTQSNVTMDEDALSFLRVLEQLAAEKAAENPKEDDSILSQHPIEEEQNEDSVEDFHDLSMPLAAVTTPKKMEFQDVSDKSDDDDNYFNTTLVPQVDGQTEMLESSDDDDKIGIGMTTRSKWRKFIKDLENDKGKTSDSIAQTTTGITKCQKSMPDIGASISASDFNTNLYAPIDKFNLIPFVKLCRVELPETTIRNRCPKIRRKIQTRKTPEEKFENTLRLIRYRINRICSKNKIKKIGRIIGVQETNIEKRLQKVSKPKFNVVAGKKWFLESPQNENSKIPILSRILKQTYNFTDPALYLFINHSNKKFLFNYGGKPVPEITELPNIYQEKTEKIIIKDSPTSCSINEKKILVLRNKIRDLQNKILNIKIKQSVKCDAKEGCELNASKSCEVSYSELPENDETPVKNDLLLGFEASVRSEAVKANITLQRHIQKLNDFDLCKAPLIDGKVAGFNSKNNSEPQAKILFSNKCGSVACTRRTATFRDGFMDAEDNNNGVTLDQHKEAKEDIIQRFFNDDNKKSIIYIDSSPKYFDSRFESDDDDDDDDVIFVNREATSNVKRFRRQLSANTSNTTDSDYASLSTSTNSSRKNTLYESDPEYSLSMDSVCTAASSSYYPPDLTKPFSSRICVISDITLCGPLQVECLQHGGTSSMLPDLFESNRNSFECGGAGGAVVDIVNDDPHIEDIQPNIYFNCDGVYDDSSSEDEKTVKTNHKRRRKASGVGSQYAPLQISTTKSPRVLRSALKSGIAENMLAVSKDTNLQEPLTKENKPKTILKSNINFKRKINFDNETTPLNSTTLEEHVSCEYSPRVVSKTRVVLVQKSMDNIGSQKSEPDALQDQKLDMNLDINSDNSQSVENFQSVDNSQSVDDSQSVDEVSPKGLDSTYSDADLFSEGEDMNKSFFRNCHLTAAEKYDREMKYKAKEGCSTVFSSSSAPAVTSSGHSSSDITPYQESQSVHIRNEIQDTTIVLSSENNQAHSKPTSDVPFKLLKPIFNAPTRNQVEASLDEFNIPHAKFTEPFYSDVQDYTGAVEIGHSVLKIPSKTTCHLPEFETDLNSLSEYRKTFTQNIVNLVWNATNLKSLKLSHCPTRDIVIRPIKKPPTSKMVQQWLKEVLNKKEVPVTSNVNVSRSKIYIPISPGRDGDDLELSLSLTPCTPSTPLSPKPSDPVTPKTSLDSDGLSSPTMEHRKKKFRRKKGSQSKLPAISESILTSGDANKSCQITGVSQHGTYGFNRSVQNLRAVRAVLECQNLTTMVMELHVRTRGDLKPDPEYDPICAVFYSILNDVPESNLRKSKAMGIIASNVLPIHFGVPDDHFLNGIGIDCDITYADTEANLINSLLSLIKYWDPDIFAGYEIQMLSWGYLIDRALVLSINIIPMLGRSKINKYGKVKSQKDNNFDIETVVTGRIILDVWRLMRSEIALQSYTFESIVYHILHRRVPMFAFKDLTFWWDHRTNLYRHRVVSYYLLRVDTVLELFHKLDFLNRTSELASLFGIQFYEVLSRGSQFRVESMMLRLAKPLNYVPVSPSQQQRATMKAPEYIALVMEPESKLYSDPVIVLDFQSLYPSIIIAYNYCFTTCVGRVNYLGSDSPFEFGATHLKLSRRVIEKLSKRNLLNFAPCGVAFVKQKVRQGILPRMLTEILDTRLMVKDSMKENKDNESLRKVLHNRQLGLKLIANVTYGYTAANFSGRMCCVEVGDSVVSKARETLQRAIAMVETTAEWGAKVVYGDTDSLFVMVPGKTKETAFEVGKKIADAITADNPDPIKLKLEKVYQPCILQTKKRYVGYMYESADQKDPVYDAKGIETVRRDGCPAVSKMLQKCLTLLFETKDVSLIKKYVLRQFHKIQIGRASIQDLTFAKEYRGASGYKPGACVPALELARKWKAVDRRSEPRSGERVPYVIVNGPPGLPLIRLVRSPRDLLNDNSLRPNSLYYITKVIIPPINRCLNLIGADLFVWFNQMPRKNTLYLPNSSPIVKSTISQYFISKICASCSRPTQNELCDVCRQNVHVTAVTLAEKLKRWEENHYNTKLICQSCTGHINENNCISLDCPVLYRLAQTYHDLQQSAYVREITLNDTFSEQNFFEEDCF